jgi:predicted nucleotidyltransferase
MKLRVKSNSLRYRLTRTDVDQLSKEGYLKETVNFGDNGLAYALNITNGDKLSADYKNNTVNLYMPKSMLDELNNTDRVGFEGNNDSLYLLVEKDFTCLDNVAEDQSDNYPNPLAVKNYEQSNE